MEQKELIQNLNKYRKDNDIFKRSIAERSPKFTSITYDGPPFASGTPHFGHGITSSMKDAILRYKTMKGYRVNRDWGWDCHGLPVEKAVEKHLGIDGRKDIEEKVGIQKFVEECRNYVSNTSDERRTFIDQLGRWADMDHAYYTMDLSFMQSVLRTFQTMYNQNLVYKGFKVQRYCPSCATTLANNEVNEGYKDRQDPAITIKFPLYNDNKELLSKYEATKDGFVQVTDCVIKKDLGPGKGNKFLMQYHNKDMAYYFPGGKVEKGDSLEDTVRREIKEEVGVEVTSMKELGSFKHIVKGHLREMKFVETEISGEPKNMEPEKHAQLIRAEIIDSDNSLGFAVKIEGTIIDDDHEIIDQFYDLYVYHQNITGKVAELQGTDNTKVSVLAWTTTPRTLPSNMFAAVGKHIHYVMVFDPSSKEYYIMAENLVKQYYKEASEYILVDVFTGEDLAGLTYEPLFPYINKSKIDKKYKDQFFKIITGEFVSTEDGTGIVHIAPSFGVEDFEAVAQFLPREEAKKRIFLPINEYGEFTDEVPDWKGVRVYDANKDIIQRLKDEKKLIGQRSYNHSYPHCRRCDTPLVSKAVTSWFIKEPELQPLTVPHAQEIGFVPEAIKNRFEDVLKTAPDRNLSRNRYRGAPLPVREAVTSKKGHVTSGKGALDTHHTSHDTDDDRIVIGTLEELFQNTKTGSANITKNIIARHGRTDYNDPHMQDNIGIAHINKLGVRETKRLKGWLKKETKKDKDIHVYISPLMRCRQTIMPYLETRYDTSSITSMSKKYEEVQTKFHTLRKEKKILSYLQDSSVQKTFEIGTNVYVDFRIMEMQLPPLQDQQFDCDMIVSIPTKDSLFPDAESIDDLTERMQSFLHEVNKKHQGQTIITVTHAEPATVAKKVFKDFDYLSKRNDHYAHNRSLMEYTPDIHYRDNDRSTEVDLHKPYIDNYRFKKGAKEYRRVPEVMDCRFESGSMPFGQVGYIGQVQSPKSKVHKVSSNDLTTGRPSTGGLIYPADFIIEGLDQTRGWFRTLHVVGNAVMGKNSFNNVIINGMILAEDGKKMAKKLKNYPDPEYLFDKYGSDAYRLYMLSSPGVRAEPVKFSEKGVDQIYKDFTAAIINAYKFFETYAKVDNFSYSKPTVYFLRHGESEGMEPESPLTTQAQENLKKSDFIEKVLRTNPDIIYSSPFTRAKQTAEVIQDIIKEYLGKKVKIKIDETLSNNETVKGYQKIIKKEGGKNVLIVSHIPQFEAIWSAYYPDSSGTKISKGEIIKLPSYKITNELDKWILAELNNLGIELESQMDKYVLDNGAKLVLGFIDKLNNRYIRRSRRRFRAAGMDEDKTSAYHTMFEVLENYMKIAAPFTPFITEYIYLELQKFKNLETESLPKSVHLEHLPLSSIHYINKDLLSEIETVRRIISLGLFIRSKNRIAVKQPLTKIELKIDG